MRILMMTNTYSPYTGGVERSIESFTKRFRKQGHRVLIVAPKSEKPVDEDNDNVFRVAAIKNFNDTNFPVTIPLPGVLVSRLEEFEPEVVHSHFPFIIGSTAIRVAASYEIPLIFTYHTMYERYIHYVNADSDRVRAFVKSLTAGYANLCDMVIAPSQGVKTLLRKREVTTPIKVIPTGVDKQGFSTGDGDSLRRHYQIPEDRFVVGHLGRLASEKNLTFLMDAVGRFLKQHPEAYFLIVGDGPIRGQLQQYCSEHDMDQQVIFTGELDGQTLVDAYHAMNLFVFASQSETQGMVLAEAMAAGLPVVALKASGVTDILRDGENGYMVEQEAPDVFAEKMETCFDCDPSAYELMKQHALETAAHFSIDACASRVLDCYRAAIQRHQHVEPKDETIWQTAMDLIKAEWEIFCNYVNAAGDMVSANESEQE